jgi:uncharacterized membrane protein
MDSKPVMEVAGWEAFVHGVFAIAVTLLVLDIRIPDGAEIDALGPLIWLVALATALLANGTITLILIATVIAMFMFEVPIGEQPDKAAS